MKIQSNLIKTLLILAFALTFSVGSALADDCSSAVPQLVGSVGSETKEGNGYWEPGWFPLIGDKPCEEEQKGRGIRYKKVTTRFTTTFKMLSGEWLTMKHYSEYEAGANSYMRTNSHWSSYDGDWPGSPTETPYSSSPEWQSMFQRSEAAWDQARYELNESRSSALLPRWENGPEHYGSGTNYVLGGAFGITITDPTITHNVHYSSEKLIDGRWRSTTITGRISTCPGKYKVTLYYVEMPGGEEQSIEEEFEFEDRMPVGGYPVSMPLPTTECKRTDYIRMEYVAVDSCGDAPSPPGSGGSGNKSVMSITHLGRKRDGGSAGSLYLHKPSVMADVFSPGSLEYLAQAGSGADAVIRSADGALRQLRMPEFLVDITPVTVSATPAPVVSGYQIDFYPLSMVEDQVDPGTGTYLLKSGASASYTKRHDNPDAPTIPNSSATKLRVTSQHAGGSPQVDLFENVTGGISLSLANGLKRVVKTTAVSGNDTTTTEQFFSPATATVPDFVSSTVTRSYSFGQRLVEESQGTGTARIWTSYTYDDTASSATYGLLKLRQSWNGAWERYDYYSNGDLRYTWSPLTDADSATTTAALLKCVEQVKTPVTGHALYGDGELVTTIELRGGVEIARSHEFTKTEPETIFIGADDTTGVSVKHKIDSRAAVPGAGQAWDGIGNLLTHTYYASAGVYKNEILRQDRPDGTILLLHHWGNAVIENWDGQPNAERTDIVAGTRKVTERTGENLLISEIVRDVATESGGVRNSGLVLSEEQYSDHDVVGRPETIVYLDGSIETRSYNTCCGKMTSSSRNGITTSYGYDALGRLEWEMISAGEALPLTTLSEVRYTYDANDQVRTKQRRAYVNGASGALQLIERNDYDNAGALTANSTPGSLSSDPTLTRVVAYQSSHNATTGRTTKTTTKPDNATEITTVHRSGSVYSRTGTATSPVRYDYGTATLSDAAQWGLSTSTPVPYTREIKLDAAGANTPETVTTYLDFLGRPIKVLYADGAVARSFYNSKGQLVRQTDPDGAQTLFTYNELGERLLTVVDYNRNGTNTVPGIELDGTDRVTRTTTIATIRGTTPVRRTTTDAWLSDGTDSATEIATVETSLDDLQTWQTLHGQTTHTLVAYDSTTGTRTETITRPDQSQSVRVYLAGRLTSETRKDSSGTAIAETLNGYDGYGRLQVVSQLQAPGSALPAPNSPLATTYTYYADDQVASLLTPDPDLNRSGVGYDPQLTSYHYDIAGRVDDVTQPDNTHAYTSYWPTGQVKRTSGSRTYPSEYAYDAQGRVKTLTTWKDFASSDGAAITTWNYDPQRGWLSSKVYAGDVTGPSYTYWPSGRLKTRVWARGVTTTYTYNNAGDLWTVVYSDSTTPTVTTLYDRIGRPQTITDAAGTLTKTYDRGLPDDESYTGGLLAGRALTRVLETNTGAVTVARPGTLNATGASTLTYGYDIVGRLQTITEASGPVATLGYKPLVGALQSVTVANAGANRLASNRVIDQLGRVASVDFDNPAPGLMASRVYTYDGANQRVQVEHEDTRRWAYGYDGLGQVNLAEKRQSNNSVLPGYAYAFDYDDIGNRQTATANGRVANYTSDVLNRYLARGTPLWADVRGKALSTASVLVNDQLTTRTGDDFYLAVPVGGLKENALKIQAARPASGQVPEQAVTENRTVLVPAVPEGFGYDADGNLTQDGLWSYEWDGENRLKVQELRSNVAAMVWKRLEYAYDGQGRRIQKVLKTKTNSAGAWTTESDTRFLYDGWTLIAEYAYNIGTFTALRSHAWGLDLSDSAQGAGGVGGLLWTKVTATAKTYAAGSDANGNVMVYVDCADGTVAGRRDYGAFGEPVLTTGVAGSLPFGFSTKFEEKESGLYYYGLRYYNPSTGRWLSRDPIQEEGGINLYATVSNNLINMVDLLGAIEIILETSLTPRMVAHYIGRSGTDFSLSMADVVALEVQPALDVFLHHGVSERLLRVAATLRTEAVYEADNAIRSYFSTSPMGNNSLGSFFIRAKGEIRCREGRSQRKYVFTGEFRVEDRFDFENYWASHRSFMGNIKTTAMEFLVPGVAFNVRSAWIPVEQVFGENPVW